MESKYYFPLYPNLISKILLITIRYTQAWCNKKCFLPGGKHLPGDYVDEGNHLLFISKQVVTPSPQIGHHLETEKKRKVQAKEKSRKKIDIISETSGEKNTIKKRPALQKTAQSIYFLMMRYLQLLDSSIIR